MDPIGVNSGEATSPEGAVLGPKVRSLGRLRPYKGVAGGESPSLGRSPTYLTTNIGRNIGTER